MEEPEEQVCLTKDVQDSDCKHPEELQRPRAAGEGEQPIPERNGDQENGSRDEDSQTSSQQVLEFTDEDESVLNTSLKRRQRWNMGAVSRIVLQPELPGIGSSPMRKKKEKIDPTVEGMGEEAVTPKSKGWGTIKQKAMEFRTADLQRDQKPEFVIYSLRDFVLYLLFLILAIIIAFGSLAYAYNFYANVLTELLTNSQFESPFGDGVQRRTFKDIHKISDIWVFMNSVLLKVLYPYAYPSPISDQGVEQAASEDAEVAAKDPLLIEGVSVLVQNILMGVPQLRQLRVKNDTCHEARLFKGVYRSCYDYYSKSTEDTANFGLAPSAQWVYEKPDEEYIHHGFVSDYGEGGYLVNLTRDVNFTQALLKELEANLWIQQGTRAVFVDFTLYSAHANLFCVVELMFEIIPTGGVLTKSNIFSLKLLRYLQKTDYFIAGCEIVFIIFVFYYTFEEVHQIAMLKESYLGNWWNILDLTIIVLSYAAIALGIMRFLRVQAVLPSKVAVIYTDQHAAFEELAWLQNSFNIVVAILTFFIWAKLLKFSVLIRSVSLIMHTFGQVKLELVALVFMMTTIVMGFSLLGFTLFGGHVAQFRTLHESFFTLIGLFIGGLYFYVECRYAAPVSAPVFFGVYIFLVLVLSLSAFVAVIVHGFHKATRKIDDVRDHVYLNEVWDEMCLRLCGLCRRKKFEEKFRARLLRKLLQRDYDALLSIIRRHGYHGLDLSLLVQKHKIQPGEEITFDTMSNLYNDLVTRNQLHMEVEEHDKIIDQVEKINRTIEFLDLTLDDILSKVDILANKLVVGGKR